jgi:predicted RNase H-like HicB family nuclease
MSKFQHEHRLQYHCHKGATGEYIGQLVDLPGVIAHANTREKLKREITDATLAYLQAFPEDDAKLTKHLAKTKKLIEQVTVRVPGKHK